MLLSSHGRQKSGICISTSIQESNAALIYWRFGAPRIGKLSYPVWLVGAFQRGWQGL